MVWYCFILLGIRALKVRISFSTKKIEFPLTVFDSTIKGMFSRDCIFKLIIPIIKNIKHKANEMRTYIVQFQVVSAKIETKHI